MHYFASAVLPCFTLRSNSGSPGECCFTSNTPPPHAPSRVPLPAVARTHAVATALLARERRLLGVVPPHSSAWPGVCAMAGSTCVRRCESYSELTVPLLRWSQVSRSRGFQWHTEGFHASFYHTFHFGGTSCLGRRQPFRAVCHPPRLSSSSSTPAANFTVSTSAVRSFPGAPSPQVGPPCLTCLAPKPEILHSCACADHASARPAAAFACFRDLPQPRRSAQASSTEAARRCTVPSSSELSPPTYPPFSAARAEPQAGLIRLTQGAVIREFSRTTSTSSCPNTILNVANLLTASQGP